MEIRNLFHKGGSLADLWYKEKQRKADFEKQSRK